MKLSDQVSKLFWYLFCSQPFLVGETLKKSHLATHFQHKISRSLCIGDKFVCFLHQKEISKLFGDTKEKTRDTQMCRETLFKKHWYRLIYTILHAKSFLTTLFCKWKIGKPPIFDIHADNLWQRELRWPVQHQIRYSLFDPRSNNSLDKKTQILNVSLHAILKVYRKNYNFMSVG
jgi:hypothetical protein